MATFIAKNAPCPWTFFLAEESYLLARTTERMLEHTERGKEYVDNLLERITQLLENVRRLQERDTQIFAKSRMRVTIRLVLWSLLCGGVQIYSMWSSTL